MGIETGEDVEPETQFTGPQLATLNVSVGGYYGAVQEIERALDTITEAENHVQDAFTAINAIRAEAGQELIEPRRLNEIRRMSIVEVCGKVSSESTDMFAMSTS